MTVIRTALRPFWVLGIVMAVGPAAVPSAESRRPQSIEDSRAGLRVHALPDGQGRYEVVFETRVGPGAWTAGARLAPGQTWTVYDRWADGWPRHAHPIKAARVEKRAGNQQLVATARAMVGGHRWAFRDTYSLHHGLIKVERQFEHLDYRQQSPVTLETRIRVPIGEDPRLVIPANNYNNNPSMLPNLPGPKMSEGYVPGALVAYEEHRVPVPLVNVESSTDVGRQYGSILARPGRVAHGNKGRDQWWSLGVEWGDGFADLLSLSGPVATNGKRAQVYGHRNGFDGYDRAYLNVTGPGVWTKTFYVDLGAGVRPGYAFRETLWKAFEVMRPVATPGTAFHRAMALKKQFAEQSFITGEHGAAGFPIFWPMIAHGDLIQFGWCGGNLAIAAGLLHDWAQTGDMQARRQAMATIDFYVNQAPARRGGPSRCEYRTEARRWDLSDFHGVGRGIGARQFSENLLHLAYCIEFARDQDINTDAWVGKLVAGCDYLAGTPRIAGLLPRVWTADGKVARPEKDAARAEQPSTSGAYAVATLAKAYQLTDIRAYRDAAIELLEAYYRAFGQDLRTPYWGGTNDAGCEDKEAGWPMLAGALAIYEITGDGRYLQWARDAADWTLTWMYFHDVGMPADPVLDRVMNTIGWTFISLHNQEIDVFGYWMAPDYYRLGVLTGDDRYRQIGNLMFQSLTQTIARPGEMVDLSIVGRQSEHYNHSNCTYVPGGRWRGQQHSAGIGWVSASQLLGGARLARTDGAAFPWSEEKARLARLTPGYDAPRRKIIVDADPGDWRGIRAEPVGGAAHLWFGQNMIRSQWHGDKDLSFRWRAAWHDNRLYFLIEVTDDRHIDPPCQLNSFLNDCVKILLDPTGRGGRRFLQQAGKKHLRGYEMHFLPSQPPRVFVDDARSPMYPLDTPQNDLFRHDWSGQCKSSKTDTGYLLEIGFSVPNTVLRPGTELGLDVDVCDDDGHGRKSLQIWTGKQVQFWITMDHYGRLRLVE